MIGPVSATGQTMMQSLQNAMSKGMPVDQAIAYVKSMAMDGIAPLTDLYSMMLQFQRLKQPTRRPPEGESIREQLQSLQNSQPQDPMAMGLASMNAGAMENPSFAGGGIVAFQQGGGAQTQPASVTPELYGQVPQFKSYDEMAEFYNKQLQDPRFVQQEMARREALAREQGLGEFGQSFELREDLLEEDKIRAETVAAEEAGYDEDEYWGDVADQASKSGATLLTSLAKAQKGKASRKRATAEKARQAIRDAKNTEILLAQAREAEKAGRLKEAEVLHAKAAESATAAREKSVEAKQKEVEDLRSRDTQFGVAKIYRDPAKGSVAETQGRLLEDLNAMRRAGKTNTPEYKDTLDLYQNSFQQVAAARAREAGKLDPEKVAQLNALNRRLTSTFGKERKDLISQIDELMLNLRADGASSEEIAAAMQGGAQGGTQGVLKYNPATGKIE
jgi:hypothetical protein